MLPPSGKLSLGAVVGGRYRLEQILGEGGAGVVFVASDQSMERSVAVKVLRPDMLHLEGGLERFRREAELARRLSHPNTIRVLDFGQDATGVPFIVFELLRGASLEETIQREGPLPFRRVAEITGAVLKSLMEAHAMGVVHRDVKPSNIFLCDATQGGIVKVLDFGVARIDRATRAVTEAGDVLGTPRYMAPEQVRGEPVGPETDLYALGLVAAEALAGRPVYADPSAVRVCMQQIEPAPVPLPPIALSSPLGPVLTAATQKNPAQRFRSAADMLDALLRAEGLPTSTSSGPTPAPMEPARGAPQLPALPPARAHWAWLWIGVLLAIALLGAISVAMLRREPPSSKGARASSSRKGPPADSSSPKTVEIELARIEDLKRRVSKAGWRLGDLEIEALDEGGIVIRGEVTRYSRFGDVELYELDSEKRAAALAKEIDAETEEDLVRRDGRTVARAWIHGGPEAMENLVEALLE